MSHAPAWGVPRILRVLAPRGAIGDQGCVGQVREGTEVGLEGRLGEVGHDRKTAWVGRGRWEEFGVRGEEAVSEHKVSGR
jgi:hypothetical protein